MYTIEIFGARQWSERLARGAKAAANPRPALWEIREDMFRVIRATFTGQGRRFGGSWVALKPETVERKLTRGLDPRILMAKHRLMESMTRRGHPNMRSRVTRDTVLLNTTLPYAETHQYGDEDRGIPARPFVDFYPQDATRWTGILKDYLAAAVRGV